MSCAAILEIGLDPFTGVMGVSRGSSRIDEIAIPFNGNVFALIYDVPRTREATFIVNEVLEKLADTALVKLANSGWTGCEESDTVGLLHSDLYDEGDAKEIVDGAWLGDDGNSLDGYEVVIDAKQGNAWLRQNRPHLIDLLLELSND